MDHVILVHGGAGTWLEKGSMLHNAVSDCQKAAEIGRRVLGSGGSALDAVEEATRALEDSPVLDAGRGSYLNAVGQVEMDALIMDGESMQMGAVAAVTNVFHPISLARLVMTDSEHNFLVARGAELFADEHGFPRCTIDDLVTDYQRQLFKEAERNQIRTDTKSRTPDSLYGDTVGAVALDQNGNLASATSTGGTRGKYPGRVGDSPLVGSGAYADNWTAAVSATGHGESLMKVLISKRVCDFVADGLSTQKACEAAIDVLKERVSGKGGVIAVDIRGRVGIAFNTLAMPYAYAVGNGEVIGSHK